MSDQPTPLALDTQTLHIVASNLTVAHYVALQRGHQVYAGATADQATIMKTFDQFVRLLQERQDSAQPGG